MSKFTVCVLVLGVAGFCLGTSLNLGTTVNGKIAYVEEVTLSSVPFTIRTKNVFYTNETSNIVIKGIAAIDVLNGEAKPTVTSGGIGSSYVNIRLKSKRGDGLHYLVQIFI